MPRFSLHRPLRIGALALALFVSLTACVSVWQNRPSPTPVPVFHTEGGQLLTPDNRPFVARGINLQYGDRPAQALPAIRAIAGANANIIRLQLRRNTTAAQLKAALDEAVRNRMPVMVMFWETDITCNSDSQILRRDVQDLWLNRWADVLSAGKYQPYLLLNIANEWGTSKDGYADYMATYTDLITSLRVRGYRMPLVIDAADCGQNTETFLNGRAEALLAADPEHNLIVSVHAYNKPWNSHEKIDANIAALKKTGVAFMLGEFGSDQMDLPDNGVDHMYLMQTAEASKTGWIAWSWKGNGGPSRVLDMSTRYDRAELTVHGENIVNGQYGLRATARR